MLRYTFTFFSFLFFAGLHAQTFSLSGEVITMTNDPLGNVTIELLDEDDNLISSQVIDCGDTYSFDGLVGAQSYQIRLSKDNEIYNGVSTFDIVLITKHLLLSTPLSSEYLERAADLDDSGSISIMDLVRLRAIVLGISVPTPDDSWLFFQETAGTEGPSFPIMLMTDQTNYDFIGVNRGDVNGSAEPCQ